MTVPDKNTLAQWLSPATIKELAVTGIKDHAATRQPPQAGSLLNPTQQHFLPPATSETQTRKMSGTCDISRYLDSEAPHGAYRDARDGPEVVGGHDGTLSGAAHTGHALPCGEGCVSTGSAEQGQEQNRMCVPHLAPVPTGG